MGWFEEQMKKRKKLDEQTFEDSFLSLAGIRKAKQGDLSDEAVRDNFVLSQILSYYRHPMVDVPNTITKFQDKLSYVLGRCGIEYHKVVLNDQYIGDGTSPLLIFTILNEIPVVLFPKGPNEYSYVNYQTGKKVRIDASLVNRLEIEAYCFFRPLPKNKATVKDYAKYVGQSVRPLDIVLLVLFAALATGVGLLLPMLTRILTGDVATSQDLGQFVSISIYVVAAATGLLLVKAIQNFVNIRIAINVEKGVLAATMRRVLSLPASFFKKYNTGELTARASSVPQLANLLLNGIFVTLVSAVKSLAYLFQLTAFAPALIGPVALVLVAMTAFSIATSFARRKWQKKRLELSSKEAGVTYEIINGIQKIRLSGSEKRVFAKWAAAYAKDAKVRYNPPLILRLSPAISLLISLLGSIALYFVAAKTGVDAGSYAAFVASYGVLSAAFLSVADMVGVICSLRPLYEMARPILETQPEIEQEKEVVKSINGNIRFENVSFRYNDSAPLVLDKLSLDIKEGEYVAIVGRTGCGKSTLVRLLLGFEKPIEGKIYFDGKDLETLDASSLRRNIGSVMQNGSLFHADIYSNTVISAPSLTEEDAWKAAEIANIADDIREMPMGMKTVISEGQGGISGGQKQRIMIARAIVHKPKVLVFDEATSALDNKTQKSISDSINKLNCTRLVIAHRLSTIKNADRILMLEDGKIIEEGTYNALIEKKGKFAELVDRQRLDGGLMEDGI